MNKVSLLIKNKAYDPTKANTTAGIPNLIKTSLLNWLPIIESLNILLQKWTIPVSDIAISGGKK